MICQIDENLVVFKLCQLHYIHTWTDREEHSIDAASIQSVPKMGVYAYHRRLSNIDIHTISYLTGAGCPLCGDYLQYCMLFTEQRIHDAHVGDQPETIYNTVCYLWFSATNTDFYFGKTRVDIA